MDAREVILKYWGNDVLTTIERSKPLAMSFDVFMKHCTACGGNWGGMLLTGIRELRPQVWDAIPDNMGSHAWLCITSVIELLGVEC